MIPWIREKIRNFLFLFPGLLARLGFLDRERGREAFALAMPVMVIGGVRIIMRLADYIMVSRAMEDAAVAGLTLGFQYYFIGFGLALALSSGTISVVSRFVGAGKQEDANLSIKISMGIALLLSIPLTIVTWFSARWMIGILTDDPAVVQYGSVYLKIVMMSVTFRFWSMIGARALAGSGDTKTPMWIRLISVPTNILLNWFFIFGVGPFPEMGVAGAALGTVLADTLGVSLFFVVLISGSFNVRLNLGGSFWDSKIAREIVKVGTPLAGMRLAMTFGRFPFMFIVATVGTSVLASFGIGRRVMLLALMPAWGYSTAASTLVGQSIGREEPDQAEYSAWQSLRIAIATQLIIGLVLAIAAHPIAVSFGSESPATTAGFIRILGIGVLAYSVSRTMQGSLRGAGDTSWPFYGTLIGTLIRVGLAVFALPPGMVLFELFGYEFAPGMGWGVTMIYFSILVDMYTRAGFNLFRFKTGKWREIGRISETDRTLKPATSKSTGHNK